MLIDILLGASGLLLLVLCLGVFLSNPRKPVNRALTFFMLSGFIWLAANFLANISTSEAGSLFLTRSTLVGAALVPLAFLSFVVTYTRYRKFTLSYFARIAALPFTVIIFTPTTWNILSVGTHGRNAVAGPIYLLLIVILISYFSFGIYVLAKFYKHALSVERAQLQYIFAGLVFTLVPGLITNGILPVFGSSAPSAYGPSVVVIFSIFTTLAIVKHRLLDIRLVVARSLAYLLVLTTLGAVFVLLVLAITTLFFRDQHVSMGIKATYVVVAVAVAFVFQPLKLIFDRITNSLFYRDAYEPQVFIDQLNKVIVSNIELKALLERAARIVIGNIKIEYCYFIVREGHTGETRIFGSTTEGTVLDEAAMRQLDNSLLSEMTTRNRTLVVDYVDDLSDEKQAFLNTNNIAALTLITPRLKGKSVSAHMVLGTKKSGNPYSSQDVRILGIISNEISVALQNALQFEEISRFNITLQQKVDEATRELRRANTRLKELDATKDEFISMASHQLRTPLTTVKGYLSMILEGDVGTVKKDQKELMQHAFDGANRMVYLIADLLNVSRLQSGKFVIDNKPANLAEVVSSEISQLNEQAANREVKLTYHKPDGFPVLNLDETKIRQVVMNFLDNALYYTPKGGSVTVDLQATDKEVSYTVTDTGVGVPKDAQHHLFSKFYRADNARKMRPDGTGLGLYMAKKVIAAQGGAIIFRSTEGKGSTFGFSFPRKAMEAKAVKTKA